MTDDEIALLEDVAVGRGGGREGQTVRALVTGCAYACCGKGWRRKDGYLQKYTGMVQTLELPAGDAAGTFQLHSAGIGTATYFVAVRFFEVEELIVAGAHWPAHW